MISNLRLWRLGAAIATCALAAVLFAGAPGVRTIDAVAIPVTAPPTQLPLMLVLMIVAVGIGTVASFVPIARYFLYGYLTTCISWALVGSTRFPWWLLASQGQSPIVAPEPGVIFLVGLTLSGLLVYLLMEALETYKKSALERGVKPDQVKRDMQRVTINYLVLCAIALVVGLVLLATFEGVIANAGWVPQLSGDTWGSWILVLIGTLIAGILLLLGRARVQAKEDEWKPVK